MRQMFDESEIRKIVKQEAPQINELDLTYGESTVTYNTNDGLSINSTMKQTLSNGASAEGQMDLSIPIVPGDGINIYKQANQNKVVIKANNNIPRLNEANVFDTWQTLSKNLTIAYYAPQSDNNYLQIASPDAYGTDKRASMVMNVNGQEYYYRIPEATGVFVVDTQLKTLFGNQSIVGSGNIDLFKHNIKGVSGASTFYLRVYSSKNLQANSITDLKTILGDTFEESATGSNGIVAITETKVLFGDGTDASISEYTITDKVTTI